MKKVISFFAVVFLSFQAVFANVEMNLSFGYSPYDFISLVDEEENSLNVVFKRPFDFGMQWGFYFGSPVKFLDVGLGLSYGLGTFSKFNLLDGNDTVYSGKMSFAAKGYIYLAPSIRFNISEHQSFVVNPGFGMNSKSYSYDSSSHTSSFNSKIFMFNLNLGYRFWFVNNKSFLFGLGAGYELSLPVVGYAEYRYGADYDNAIRKTGSAVFGTENKFYLSMVFNFGKRGLEKYLYPEESDDDDE